MTHTTVCFIFVLNTFKELEYEIKRNELKTKFQQVEKLLFKKGCTFNDLKEGTMESFLNVSE